MCRYVTVGEVMIMTRGTGTVNDTTTLEPPCLPPIAPTP